MKKTLSGGERKRLNIGLDMIGSADVYLFDEPTSGLVSKDSEHVIEIIRAMAHNKIILVTIHQPTSKLFQMFHKAMLLDKGGRMVFFGTPTEMLRYFAEAEHQQQFGTELGGCPSCGTTRPEFIFDVLETPLRDISGDIIYEENTRGQLVAARRYSPEYWRDKYEAFRLIQDVKQVSLRRGPAPALAGRACEQERFFMRWRDEWTQFRTLMRRSFMSKLRNRAQPRHHDRRRAGAGAAHRHAAALFRERRIRFRLRLPHPDLHLPQPDRGDVPRPDEQRGRHHPRSRGSAARAQSRTSGCPITSSRSSSRSASSPCSSACSSS